MSANLFIIELLTFSWWIVHFEASNGVVALFIITFGDCSFILSPRKRVKRKNSERQAARVNNVILLICVFLRKSMCVQFCLRESECVCLLEPTAAAAVSDGKREGEGAV